MKITIFLLLFMSFQAYCGNGYSQSAKISIPRSNMKVSELLTNIEDQTDYLFVYNKKNVDTRRMVEVQAEDTPVSDVLNQAFNNTDIRYVTEGHNIVLTKNGEIAALIQQQEGKVTVKGTVTDQNGEPIIGANVLEKGTTNGGITDIDGNYSITLSKGAVLQVTYIGYQPQEFTITNQTTVNVKMMEESLTLDQVVVTAMGIKKKEKSLTYSTQIVGGDELTRAKDPNMITALAGKTAGVQINKSASGLGGSAKVIIRGNRSASGNNQPLYVIDGVPINSGNTDQTVTSIGGTNDAGNRDGGDGVSNLNPDDIESMSILKGPSAAALYGSQAANGVVLITTKKGKEGRVAITVNSNTTIDQASYGIPEFQNSYTGQASSWGEKITGSSPDYTKDFFKTGVTTINSITLSAGTEKMQTYFSYANTYGEGVIDKNTLHKHNFNFRETASFFDNKLTLDANVSLMYQRVLNRATPGGYYINPLVGLYHFPRGGVQGGESFDYYATNYERFVVNRNLNTQNWYAGGSDMDQNPYWLINKTPSEDVRARTIANLSANYKINKNLTLQVRGNADFVSDKYNQKMYVGTHSNLAGENGRYITYESSVLQTYADALLTYQQQLGTSFNLNASFGASITDSKVKSIRLDSRPGSLFFPNVFTVANIDLNGGYIVEQDDHRQDQALFFAGQLGFKDCLFLDVTARNDWSSALAYTDSSKKGFFYPSVGLTFILNDALKLPDFVSFAKVRGSWSKVGNSIPLYVSNPKMQIAAGGSLVNIKYKPFGELKPEFTTAWEFGTEWKFFNNRVDLDFTWYKTNTTNQLFTLTAPAGSGYSYFYTNAGNIQNKGIEVVLGGTPVLTKDFSWKTSFNFATNKNKVLELSDKLTYFNFGEAGTNSYQMRLEKGGSFGDIYGVVFARDEQGKIVYGTEGLPERNGDGLKKIANCSPDFNLGWGNTLRYKNFSLYFLIDGRFGGDVLSITSADLDEQGVSKRTGEDRARGYVNFDGKKIENVEGFYGAVGGRDGITEHYVTSATNIRLRELSFSYGLPAKLFENSFIKGCDVSLVARNLFFLMNDAPYDPDSSLSTGNNLQGVDVFGMPSNRSFGLNLKLNF